MYNKLTKILTALFVVTLFSTTVVMAKANITAATQAMDKAGFTEKQVAQVESQLAFAQQKGLPEGVMVDKLQEGIAKQVAPDRIVQAIDRIAARYSHAHQLAGTLVKDDRKAAQLGNIVASGMAAGLTAKAAEEIINDVKAKLSLETKSYPMVKEAMLMARDLSRRGITAETTVEVVEKALEKGLNVDEMRALRGAFNSQGTKGSIESFAKGNMSATHSSPAHGLGGIAGDSSATGGGAGAGVGGAGVGAGTGAGAGIGGSGGSGSGGGSSGGGHR